MLRRLRRNGEGFTLIELLIVVAIIGILAAIAIPNLLSATKKTKISRALADSKIVVTQTQLYNNDFNANPPDLGTLETTKYVSQVFDPFGANPSIQKYGYEASSSQVWALSVGPNSAAPGTVILTWTDFCPDCNDSGDDCEGVVGWHNAYGAVQPIGGKAC